jgi:hypothetical protein
MSVESTCPCGAPHDQCNGCLPEELPRVAPAIHPQAEAEHYGWARWGERESQSQAFSAVQTVIPTPYMDADRGAPDAQRTPAMLPSESVQARMFAFPDVMRGQLAMETEARDA